jgi:formylmethanofuran dehydrogenase subunit D
MSAKWHKSTYSGQTGDCVDVAENLGDVVLVRDTKDSDGLMLAVPRSAWASFLAEAKAGTFDR